MVTYSIERILQREREEQKQLGLAEGTKKGAKEARIWNQSRRGGSPS